MDEDLGAQPLGNGHGVVGAAAVHQHDLVGEGGALQAGRDAVAFVVLVLVLLFRPNGLAGKTSAVRV